MDRAGVIKLLDYSPDRQGYNWLPLKLFTEEMIKFPCQLVEILLLIVLRKIRTRLDLLSIPQ